jgi:hemoglobin-like flavoprotein
MVIPTKAEREANIRRIKQETDRLNDERNKPGVTPEQYRSIGEQIGELAELHAHDDICDAWAEELGIKLP